MKIRKIIGSIIVCVFCLFLQGTIVRGQTVSWNFKDSVFNKLGTLTTTKTVENLILLSTQEKPMKVAVDNQTLGGEKFTHSLQLSGQGQIGYCSVKVPVSDVGTIKIVMKSSGATKRTLVVADKTGKQWTTLTADTTIASKSYNYNGIGDFLYLYSSNSGIHLYKIQVEDSVASTSDVSTIPSGSIVVAKDGSGAYTSVQKAINSLGTNSNSRKTIYIKDGTYNEVVTIPGGVSNLTLVGQSKNAILQYNNYSGKSNGAGGTYGTGGSAAVFIKGSDITVKSLTIKNSFEEKGNNNEQAVALSATGNRIKFNECNILGNQDTLLCDGGTQYFYKCLIAGDVDFIFGRSQGVFENCEIRSLNRGSTSNNGYITAARTSIGKTYGFLFLNCDMTCQTGTANNSVWLGRPWCPSGTSVDKAAVAYINCSMGSHIKADGWTSMSGVSPSHGRFYEYNNRGNGAVMNSKRPQLTSSQAASYTKETVLEGWNPNF